MVTGKKGKKSGKGKTVSLNDFLAPTSNNNTGDAATTAVLVPKASSWADEMDDYEETPPRRPAEKIVLPTAPRASLGPNISDDRIPRDPPFTAYLANLSYDINPEDVYQFFEKLEIKNVRLLRDGDPETGRLKGYGYADFGDRQSLIEALTMNDQLLKNRKLRIDISTNTSTGGDRDRRGGFNNRNNDRPRYGDNDDGEDRTAGDWRSGPAPAFRDDDRRDRYDPPRDRGGYDNDRRDNRGYGFDRRDNRGGGFDRRDDRGGFDRRDDRGGFDRRDDRGGFDRRDDRGGYDRRDNRGGYDRRDDRGGYDRDRGYNRGGGDRYDRRSNEPEDAPRERPRLQLAKRSAPVENAAPAETTKSSIFGGAKPVDTAKKEREIEEKLQRQQNEVKSRSRTVSEKSGESESSHHETEIQQQPPKKSSIFGDAKPVDTTKKEREIEEKLHKLDVTNSNDKDRPRIHSTGPRIHPESKKNNVGDGERSPPPVKKIEEEKPPNFIGSNKYAVLPDDDDVGSGKENSD